MERYAYANNSPLVYVDPSGYESVCGHANSDPECDGNSDVPLFSAPTLLDRSKLSRERGARTGVSAYGLYDVYLGLWENKGAWYWESGHFTLDDFNTLILYKEASTLMGDNKVYPSYQEAWARSFNSWCGYRPDICVGASDPASVLTYLSLASDSAEGIAKNPNSALEPLENRREGIVPLSQASPMLQGMSNPSWGGCVGNRPCYVGNWSLFSTDMAKFAGNRPWFFTVWGGKNENRMVIMTLCQSYYWWGGYWEGGGYSAFRKSYPRCDR